MENIISERKISDREITLLLATVASVAQLSVSMYSPSLPAIQLTMMASAGTVQITMTAYLFAFAVAQLIYGPLGDRYGRKPILIGGLVIFTIGSLICATAGSIEILILGRIVQASGACAGSIMARSIVRDVFDQEKGAQAMASVAIALAAAPAIGPLLGGYLQDWLDWHSIFFTLAWFGVLMIPLVVIRLPETNRSPDIDALHWYALGRNYISVVSNRTFLAHTLLGTTLLGGVFGLYTAIPFLIVQQLNISPTVYGWLNLLIIAVYIFGSFLSSYIIPRLGASGTIRFALYLKGLAAASFIASAWFLPLSVPSVIIPVLLWALCVSVALPGCITGGIAPFERTAGSASALMGFAQMLIGGVAAALMGLLHDATMWGPALTIIALTLTGAFGYLALSRPSNGNLLGPDPEPDGRPT